LRSSCTVEFYLFRLLREKTATDDEFVEFCKLRRGAAQETLEALLDLPVSLFSSICGGFYTRLRSLSVLMSVKILAEVFCGRNL
jgi:hypothetical protein